jgi:quercetin dioxygenase-like cupin family protein
MGDKGIGNAAYLGDLINEGLDKLRVMAFVGFDGVKEISIESIPEKLSPFPDGRGGLWKRLNIEQEDVDSCQYIAKKGHVFLNHVHYNMEITICLGDFLVETPFRSYTVKRNETYSVPANVPHKVTWLTDGSLVLVFSPKFANGGWEATLKPY